jgi:hypothetical protein
MPNARRAWALEEERACAAAADPRGARGHDAIFGRQLTERGIVASHVSVWNILRRERQ